MDKAFPQVSRENPLSPTRRGNEGRAAESVPWRRGVTFSEHRRRQVEEVTMLHNGEEIGDRAGPACEHRLDRLGTCSAVDYRGANQHV
jgi:hypothetical protein